MKSTHAKNVVTTHKGTMTRSSSAENVLFTKDNFKWMIIGLIIMALGFFLMAGGKSSNPEVFDDNAVYSPMRITVAPILIVAGLIIEIFAIMKKPK
ncbi:MAG: DUF3098 domain-containing protein [Ginsengibacter sp.]